MTTETKQGELTLLTFDVDFENNFLCDFDEFRGVIPFCISHFERKLELTGSSY